MGMGIGVIVLGLGLYGMFRLVNSSARRPVINPGKLTCLVLLALMLLEIMAFSGSSFAVGEVVGSFILPLAGFAVVANRFEKAPR